MKCVCMWLWNYVLLAGALYNIVKIFTLGTFMGIIYVYCKELWQQTFYWVKSDKR